MKNEFIFLSFFYPIVNDKMKLIKIIFSGMHYDKLADALPFVPKNGEGGSASANDSACVFRQRKTLKLLIYKVSALVRMTGVEPT